MNGSAVGSIEDTTNYTASYDLIISNESTISDEAAFGGYLAYFNWIKGVAKYTTNFTVDNTFPPTTPNTVFMVNAYYNLGSLGDSAVNTNVGTYPLLPFIATPPGPPVIRLTMDRIFQSLYTDNSRVYYKPHSLASCGVGSVKNSRYKSRHT